ncbi:MAG: CHAT domain-containing protein [Candidatus Accumulibacter phosphatis]|nr:CHAT domain-containing protein [Candidatus Accumulibacter phosphatis]
MRVQDASSTNFLRVDRQLSCERLADLLQMTNPSAVVAAIDERHAALWRSGEVLTKLATQPFSAAFDFLSTDASRQVPILDADLPVDAVPELCVVAEEGVISGVYDRSLTVGKLHQGPILIGRQTRGGTASPTRVSPSTAPCQLQVTFPSKLTLGEIRSLLVSVLPAIDGGDQTAAPPLGADIDIILQARQGMELLGHSEMRLKYAADDDALPVRFQVKAAEEGTGKLRVLAFHEGHLMSSVTVAVQVVGPATQEPAPAAPSSAPLHAAPTATSSELTLLILEEKTPPGFTVYLSAVDPSLSLNFRRFGPVALKSDARGLFDEFFKDIEQLSEQDHHQSVQAQLAQRGSWLFEKVFPEELRVLIWSLRDRITTVQIQSDEPWIPWEMCRLHGMVDGKVVEGPFFCEAFALTRWMPGVPLAPKLSISKLALVVPASSGLPVASQERDYLTSIHSATREVDALDPAYNTLVGAFASGTYDGFHFIGHGAFGQTDPDLSAIALTTQQMFRPRDVAGVVRNLGLRRPLIFLNACQTGRADFSLTDIGGWSGQFLRAGAGAFVGTYWSVFDDGAALFARTFYEALFKGTPVGHATREARRAVKATGDPSFLAYTVYAEPGATLRP